MRKSDLRDRLAAIRKAYDKQIKERETVLQKAVSRRRCRISVSSVRRTSL